MSMHAWRQPGLDVGLVCRLGCVCVPMTGMTGMTDAMSRHATSCGSSLIMDGQVDTLLPVPGQLASRRQGLMRRPSLLACSHASSAAAANITASQPAPAAAPAAVHACGAHLLRAVVLGRGRLVGARGAGRQAARARAVLEADHVVRLALRMQMGHVTSTHTDRSMHVHAERARCHVMPCPCTKQAGLAPQAQAGHACTRSGMVHARPPRGSMGGAMKGSSVPTCVHSALYIPSMECVSHRLAYDSAKCSPPCQTCAALCSCGGCLHAHTHALPASGWLPGKKKGFTGQLQLPEPSRAGTAASWDLRPWLPLINERHPLCLTVVLTAMS